MSKLPPEYLKKYKVDKNYNLKVLYSYLKPHKYWIYLMLFLMFLIELANFSANFIYKYLVDDGTNFIANKITSAEFYSSILLLIGIYVLINVIFNPVLTYFRITILNIVEARVLNSLEKDSFWHVLNLSYRYHLNKKTGALISQFTRGINKSESLMDVFVFNFIPTIFQIILSIGVIFYFDLITAVIVLLMIVSYLVLGIYNAHSQTIPQSESNYKEDLLKQNISDIFTNIETVKYFAKEKRTQNYFAELSLNLKEARIKYWSTFSFFMFAQLVILGIGITAIMYFSFKGLINQSITLGSITLIFAAVWKLIPQLWGLMHGYRDYNRGIVDVAPLYELFKEKNEVVDIPNAKELIVKNGEIEFKNVYFSYYKKKKDESVLKNFNLKIKPNTKVALVGPSGGGKSTVVKLLYRLFDLNKGAIFIDGQDISKITQESLRDNLSIVPQEPILFDNTIWFNIAYAYPEAGKEEIWKAIKFARLNQLISKLPKKEKTIVGERGIKLSGGEKQRVSIARAILANKKFLILDEATSALDSETEKEIQGYLEKLMKNRTTLVIAHRLSTVMKADIIVVIQEGRIVEIGTHAELTNKNGGLYKKLWQLQRGGNL